METAFYKGAMYARLSDNEQLDKSPILLGDGILKVGEYVRRLGKKRRTMFEMQEGWYLRYKGKLDGVLFFDTNTIHEINRHNWHYGFYYIDKNTLLIGGWMGMSDIRINHIEKFEKVHLQASEKQLSLF